MPFYFYQSLPFNTNIMILCVYRETGQQCCYNTKGEYTVSNVPAGSADYKYPFDHYLLHQSSDYFPYKACCIDSNDTDFCDLYYQLRPTGNSSCQSVMTRIGKSYVHTYTYVVKYPI